MDRDKETNMMPQAKIWWKDGFFGLHYDFACRRGGHGTGHPAFRALLRHLGLVMTIVTSLRCAVALAVFLAAPLVAEAAAPATGHAGASGIVQTTPGTAAVPPSAQAIEAQQELAQLQHWWEAHSRWFYVGGAVAFAVLLVWLLFRFRQWLRQDAAATFRCGTLLYSKKGLVLVFAWLLWGDFCFTLMETIAGSVMPWKFKDLNASDTTTSLIMTSLPAVFNFFITPSISIWSDRIRTRWGRRLPFILTTMPFLALSLVLIAYCDSIGGWIHQQWCSGSVIDQTKVTILVLAVFAGMFDLFNMFVTTVYWYLFNDVVPPEMMGRFMAYFRLVSTIATAFYSFFLFKYALSHMRELYLAAAGIYLVGFGAMCLRIKESDYPPPEDAGPRTTLRAKIKHVAESLTISHYVYWTLEGTLICLNSGMGAFGGFLALSLVLTMGNIGLMSGIQQIIAPMFLLFVGALVDRWHSVRVCAYLGPYQAFFAFSSWIWLCVDHPSPLMFMLVATLASIFAAPANAISGVAGLPRVFALLPREKFGQYNGAMCMIRAVGIFVGGILAGLYLDLMRAVTPGHPDDPNWVYRYIFAYQAFWTIDSAYCSYKVYRGWKRLGGDKSYVPPVRHFRLADLPPHPDVDGKVNWRLLSFAGVSFLGTLLSSVLWIAYYLWWKPNPHYVTLFTIAGGLNVAMFLLYLHFIKYMERP
jgi:MFS family permease